MILLAESIKLDDYKPHKVVQPNIAINLERWIKDDRNCKNCSEPGERKRKRLALYVQHTMFTVYKLHLLALHVLILQFIHQMMPWSSIFSNCS